MNKKQYEAAKAMILGMFDIGSEGSVNILFSALCIADAFIKKDFKKLEYLRKSAHDPEAEAAIVLLHENLHLILEKI